MTDPNTGAIGARKTTYQKRIKQMDDQLDRKEQTLGKREIYYESSLLKWKNQWLKLKPKAHLLVMPVVKMVNERMNEYVKSVSKI